MKVLGFKKNQFRLEGETHIQYYNRHFGYVLRPTRTANSHNSYGPGLHHLCFRVNNQKDVEETARKLSEHNISVSEPKLYPDYAPDYYAVFLSDPDGIQLEITNYRQERRQRHDNWENLG